MTKTRRTDKLPIELGRAATGRGMRALALKLSGLALEARQYAAAVPGDHIERVVYHIGRAVDRLTDVGIDVTIGRAPLLYDPEDARAVDDPMPLFNRGSWQAPGEIEKAATAKAPWPGGFDHGAYGFDQAPDEPGPASDDTPEPMPHWQDHDDQAEPTGVIVTDATASAYDCPTCFAKAGQPCKKKKGHTKRRAYHDARYASFPDPSPEGVIITDEEVLLTAESEADAEEEGAAEVFNHWRGELDRAESPAMKTFNAEMIRSAVSVIEATTADTCVDFKSHGWGLFTVHQNGEPLYSFRASGWKNAEAHAQAVNHDPGKPAVVQKREDHDPSPIVKPATLEKLEAAADRHRARQETHR